MQLSEVPTDKLDFLHTVLYDAVRVAEELELRSFESQLSGMKNEVLRTLHQREPDKYRNPDHQPMI